MWPCKHIWLKVTVFLSVLMIKQLQCVLPASVDVQVNVDKPLRKLEHFWRSTGFCPPQPHSDARWFDLSVDQQMNLALIGSVPHAGIQQVRIHWMLELLSARVVDGEYRYNFTHLDQLIEVLAQNGLKPGFELMGSVSNTFNNFEDKRQVVEWRNLVYLISKRYIWKYGLGVVSQWNFETWNEPNNHDFDNITMSIQGFLNYYDACSEGLRAASPLLKFGGPGDSCHSPPRSPYCWEMLQHCNNGTNFFTGETGVRLDYIALHKKGGGSSLPILQQEVATVHEIQQRFPQFRSAPIFNDEADPLVGWNKPLTWRADVTYAAMVAKVICEHQNLLIADDNSTVNYTLLSNDNAFLSFHPHQFTQRTLTARFQINNTEPPHVQLLRKPVLTVMGLLALLGETQVQAQLWPISTDLNSSLGVLGTVHIPRVLYTADSWQSTILLYNSRDNQTSSTADTKTLPVPSVLLVHICAQAKEKPGQVNGLRFISVTRGQVLIVWKDHCIGTKCIKTYEVEFSKDEMTFRRINPQDTIFTHFTHSPERMEVSGVYRVRAVDYWGRTGEFSAPQTYSER
ncbi:hypothetical protein DNTS_014385 [Danionella cerebrum]|uniref:Alpha-L-iduronidase n=1 Tax=Danionella cerebrum TaxID=2873325 RepID=A0A553RQT6_9TELE|nr:hypothetical protein DNTS_014385 [Danionella translucida]